MTASPTQGTLKPYEKRPVHFKFSPRGEKSSTGWAATEKPLPRRDYALFVHIDMVGSMNTFSNKSSHQLPQGERYFALSFSSDDQEKDHEAALKG